MDAFRLLTRSTNFKAGRSEALSAQSHQVPSGGELTNPQLFYDPIPSITGSKKRKRETAASPAMKPTIPEQSQFFSKGVNTINGSSVATPTASVADTGKDDIIAEPRSTLSLEDRKKFLKAHNIKVVDLSAATTPPIVLPRKNSKKSTPGPVINRKKQKEAARLFPDPITSFKQLRSVYNVSSQVVQNIQDHGYYVPTEVQLAALPLLLGESQDDTDLAGSPSGDSIDLLTIAPTGSGKTLAFLVPLFDSISRNRGHQKHASALILAPTKELVNQIVNEGRRLYAKTGIHITAMRKGMRLNTASDVSDANVIEEDDSDNPLHDSATQVKSDIIVGTPSLIANSIAGSNLAHIKHLILDEADVLLDPLFRDQTMIVWEACCDPSLRASFWSATIGSSIEDLVKSTLSTHHKNLNLASPPAPLIRIVIGLKDTSLPNITHNLIYAATEPGKLLGLRQLLHPASSTSKFGTGIPILRPPFLIFTQTIQRAIALHSELRYDIPLPAGGSSRIAVLHSDLSDTARAAIMAKFRKAQIWVLITTDLLSRGIDFRGVNGVVNYDIPTSSAGYVHRAGRTGRAGRRGGVCVTFYTKEDIPYVKNVANVIASSSRQTSSETPNTGVQKWLLDALPNVSKNDRKTLKKRGVEVRRAISTQDDQGDGRGKDEKIEREKRRARISTKSGFERRIEARRKGAALGSRVRKENSQMENDYDDDDGDEGWEGFEN